VFPGDIERSANPVASQRGINKVIAQVLPKQKEKQSLNFKIKKKRYWQRYEMGSMMHLL